MKEKSVRYVSDPIWIECFKNMIKNKKSNSNKITIQTKKQQEFQLHKQWNR